MDRNETLSKRNENLIYIAEEIRFLNIILIHPTTAFLIHLDLEGDIYRIQDNRLYNPLLWKDPLDYYDVFYENIRKAVEAAKGTILVIYNPAVAICTGALRDLFKSWKANPVTCLYFYNNDDDIASAYPDIADDLISESNEIYDQIAQYPHIKKFEIPVDFKISFRYLLQCSHTAM